MGSLLQPMSSNSAPIGAVASSVREDRGQNLSNALLNHLQVDRNDAERNHTTKSNIQSHLENKYMATPQFQGNPWPNSVPSSSRKEDPSAYPATGHARQFESNFQHL